MRAKSEERRKIERRKSSLFRMFVQFFLDMHSSESQTSWTRWIASGVIFNIMIMWTLNCLFNEKMQFCFSLEEMPGNLLAIILGLGAVKVAQSGVEKYSNGKTPTTGTAKSYTEV